MDYKFRLKSVGQIIAIKDYFATIDYTISVPTEGFLLEFVATGYHNTSTTPQSSTVSTTVTSSDSTPSPNSTTTESSDSPTVKIGLTLLLMFSILLII